MVCTNNSNVTRRLSSLGLAHAVDSKAGDFLTMLPLKKTASVRLFSTKIGADDEAGLRTAFNVHLGGERLLPLMLTLDNDFEVDDFLGTQPCADAGWSTVDSTRNLQINFATGVGAVWGHSCLSEPLDWSLTDNSTPVLP